MVARCMTLKPGSTDGDGDGGVTWMAEGWAVEDVLICRTSLSGSSAVVLGSRSGGCCVVRPRGRAAGR